MGDILTFPLRRGRPTVQPDDMVTMYPTLGTVEKNGRRLVMTQLVRHPTISFGGTNVPYMKLLPIPGTGGSFTNPLQFVVRLS